MVDIVDKLVENMTAFFVAAGFVAAIYGAREYIRRTEKVTQREMMKELHQKRLSEFDALFRIAGMICTPVYRARGLPYRKVARFAIAIHKEFNRIGAFLDEESRYWVIELRELVGEWVRRNRGLPGPLLWGDADMTKLWLTKSCLRMALANRLNDPVIKPADDHGIGWLQSPVTAKGKHWQEKRDTLKLKLIENLQMVNDMRESGEQLGMDPRAEVEEFLQEHERRSARINSYTTKGSTPSPQQDAH